tara:strand:- start:653 stop:856 length:204 start_codon:yes stop_codon:yes gene_type:complete
VDVAERSACTLTPSGGTLGEARQAYPLAGAEHQPVKDGRYLAGRQGCVIAAVDGTGDAVASGCDVLE